ncbi:hypothetical protein HDV05_003546 [Chytridiales sp. JEL 0842]|nr:hypothetical protein HDV05_003546 [Chytridiales sp. JEL 0842]
MLRVMDDFGYDHHWHMSVGEIKGAIVEKIIQDVKPRVMVEIGCYMGYSAIRFAQHLPPSAHGGHYYTFEPNPVYASIASQLIQMAGLSDRVTLIHGTFAEKYEWFLKEYNITNGVDMFFIDHWKDLYLPDFLLIESTPNLTHPNTVVVADNIFYPGAPDYLEYVTKKSERVQRWELVETELEYSRGETKDAVCLDV